MDKPLNRDETPYPWEVSTRARVTPRRWKNVYNWGDFKGSPERMMEYYDAHVYLANWGSFCLMLAFPEKTFAKASLESYRVQEGLLFSRHEDRLIVAWERINDDVWDGWVDGEGLLDQLLPIREEILRGDYRALYLGWLAFHSWLGSGEDDELEGETLFEPPVPPGLDLRKCFSQPTTSGRKLNLWPKRERQRRMIIVGALSRSWQQPIPGRGKTPNFRSGWQLSAWPSNGDQPCSSDLRSYDLTPAPMGGSSTRKVGEGRKSAASSVSCLPRRSTLFT